MRNLLNRWWKRQPKPRTRRSARTFRPTITLLEDRAAPALFTVSNLTDAGVGSLRQAIGLANTSAGADQIQFAAGLSGQITLTSGELDVTDDLAIIGPGAANLTINGNNASRVFDLDHAEDGPTIAVAISGLTLTGGAALLPASDEGGAIRAVDVSLTLDDM